MILSVALVFSTACNDSQAIPGPYNITITASSGGRVTVPIEQVRFGENVSVSVKPDLGYRVKEFKINGQQINITGDTYTEYCVTEDLKIEAVFDSKYTTVHFDTDGRNTIQDRRFTIDGYYRTLPEATSSDPDDLFLGWYTKPNGKGNYVVNSTRVPEEPHTLYAYFTSKYMIDGSTLNKTLYEEYSLAVTYYNQEGTALGVSYHTAEECFYPVIQYVKGNVSSFDNLENVGEVACSKTSTSLDWKNYAVLDSLSFNTEYSLRIGDRGSRLYGEIYHFKTNAQNKTETKFLFMANSKQETSGYKDGNNAFAKTVDVATDFFSAESMDFLVHGGDFTSTGLMPEYWAGTLAGIKDYTFNMPIMPAAGDMEFYSNTNKTTNVFVNMFNIGAAEQTSSHGLYYSVNVGPAHIAVLNSNDCIQNHKSAENTAGGLITGTGSLVDKQLNWLKDDLEYNNETNPNTKWNIVVMHESLILPAYANTDAETLQYNHPMSLREQLMNVLKGQKVDLVLSAQDGESFTTNPLTYDVNNEIAITPVAGQKKNQTVNEPWISVVATPSGTTTYSGFTVKKFNGYQSGKSGTVFHQVGAIGLGKTNYFQQDQLATNLTRYGNIYNNLVSGIQSGNEYSMFSNIELTTTTLTIRTFGVSMNQQYSALSQLPYFGGVQLSK